MYYKPLLIPLLIQVFLTFLVWQRMYYTRLREIGKKRLDPQDLASRKDGQKLLTDSAAETDHFMNQFEMPVLFYTAILLALILMWQDTVLVALAWLYVLLRVVHSIIHLSYNTVAHRFWVYILSCLALLGIWIRLALLILWF